MILRAASIWSRFFYFKIKLYTFLFDFYFYEWSMRLIILCPFIFIFFLPFLPADTSAQQNSKPEGAFIRSLIVPGWGHYYANRDEWTRGQVHLGSEVVLIASYFGFSVRATNLEKQYETLASLKAGVDITDRNRTFRLALGEFNSLQEYNDFQLRSRNWNRLFEDQTENRWIWEEKNDREKYNSLRSEVDRVRNQLPAIFGLMVVNRVISAVSAYNRVKRQTDLPEITLLPVSASTDRIGVVAKMHVRF